MPPTPARYNGPSIFQEVTFQHESHYAEVLGGTERRRIVGPSYCEITLRLPATSELGAVIHNYDMSDADKLRLIAASIEEPLSVRSPEPEPDPGPPPVTGRRDMEL